LSPRGGDKEKEKMRAREKEDAVEWAAKKIRELLSAGDRAGAERVAKWAYPFARGSNDRKAQIEAALRGE